MFTRSLISNGPGSNLLKVLNFSVVGDPQRPPVRPFLMYMKVYLRDSLPNGSGMNWKGMKYSSKSMGTLNVLAPSVAQPPSAVTKEMLRRVLGQRIKRNNPNGYNLPKLAAARGRSMYNEKGLEHMGSFYLSEETLSDKQVQQTIESWVTSFGERDDGNNGGSQVPNVSALPEFLNSDAHTERFIKDIRASVKLSRYTNELEPSYQSTLAHYNADKSDLSSCKSWIKRHNLYQSDMRAKYKKWEEQQKEKSTLVNRLTSKFKRFFGMKEAADERIHEDMDLLIFGFHKKRSSGGKRSSFRRWPLPSSLADSKPPRMESIMRRSNEISKRRKPIKPKVPDVEVDGQWHGMAEETREWLEKNLKGEIIFRREYCLIVISSSTASALLTTHYSLLTTHAAADWARHITESDHYPHLKAINDLRTTSDLTSPASWYPYSRLFSRKIIYHGGPTNSGKTFNALQRLKSSSSGLYLGPLRLLALEIYEDLTASGIYCDLVTGQEKRTVPFSTHKSATVEMCPMIDEFDVVVIDEIQMLSDHHRGHAWVKALLGVRSREVHVCGGTEARNLVKRLCEETGDEFEEIYYERFNELKVSERLLLSCGIKKAKENDTQRKRYFVLIQHSPPLSCSAR